MAKKKKWQGYAKVIAGYGGQKYALFRQGKRVGESSMVGKNINEKHKAELRLRGYKIRKGYVS